MALEITVEVPTSDLALALAAESDRLGATARKGTEGWVVAFAPSGTSDREIVGVLDHVERWLAQTSIPSATVRINGNAYVMQPMH